MSVDEERIDEVVLALLWLTLHDERRAWKAHTAQRPSPQAQALARPKLSSAGTNRRVSGHSASQPDAPGAST